MDRERVALTVPGSRAAKGSVHRLLAWGAAILGGLAALGGDPATLQLPASSELGTYVATLAREIASEKDHVTALDLAQWVRDKRPGLRVIDVRSAEEREDGQIPTSETVDLAALTTTSFHDDDTVVVYSTEAVHAAQAWVLLRAQGYREVFFLRGGWSAWVDEVMHPALEEGASVEAQRAFARASVLSRYFGGAPRIDDGQPSGMTRKSPAPPTSPRRRGC
ncbi:MAG TPA: rhodanese-like domain-containing protein [Polyangiaceae bacterium]|nr:rhodanese-like domain-containing protein [Polyangiaceae bacterium]